MLVPSLLIASAALLSQPTAAIVFSNHKDGLDSEMNKIVLAEIMRSRFVRRIMNRQVPTSVTSRDQDQVIDTDENGKRCIMCNKPHPLRLAPNKTYTEFRSDCGNMKLNIFKNLADLTMDASETESGRPTNAFCELNLQKSCIDAIENKDYMYYAKGIIVESNKTMFYDGSYCLQNGWLEKEIVDLVHSDNFTAMQEKAQNLCETKYEKYNWRKMTLSKMMMKYMPGMKMRGYPTKGEAEFIGAWNCAMGDMACDMSYCAYTYCDAGDGNTDAYGKCPGWHPVNGMRR